MAHFLILKKAIKKMLKVFENPQEIIAARKAWRSENKKIGFVPTMGALHEGHATLIKKAREENDIVVLSIFVNPTQFNDKKDLDKYPKTFEADKAMAEEIGVDAIFLPNFENMYPDKYHYVVTENAFSKELCGRDRPGHFDGVLSVVMKLLNIVAPNNAYFGEKDYQQLTLIKGMVEAFFMDVNIVPVAIVRENDGLAKSSRNVRLNDKGRTIAPKIYEIAKSSKDAIEAKKRLEAEGYAVDYVVDNYDRRFIAVKTTDTDNGDIIRLIDNVAI